MFLFRLFILSTILCFINGYKILCLLPYPGKSHMMVFEPLLQELSARGNELTVVSFFPTQNSTQNRRDVSLVGLASVALEVIDIKDLDFNWYGLEKYFAHIPTIMKLADINLQLCKKLLNSPLMDEFVHRKGEYDLILVEHFNSDCMLGIVHNYGVPSIGLMSHAMLYWSFERVGAPDNPSYVPGMTVGVTDNMNFFERLENAFVLAFYLIYFEINIRRVEQQIIEQRFGRVFPKLDDIAKNTSLLLINTHHSLNGNRVLPPSVVEVGGIHLHNRTVNRLPEDLEQWISESKQGLILFSFGSLVRGSTLPDKQLNAILKVFSKLPHKVLWKWETKTSKLNLPKNVKTVLWLPQYDLLHHEKVVAFFTHGGLLSMTEAVSAGVPMIVVPLLGDQFGNAAHAKAAGVAEVLRLREIDEHSLYVAFEKILSNETQSRAKQLSLIWKDRPQSPMDIAIFSIERLARYKTLNMSSHARNLNRFQVALLDLIGFIIAIIAIFAYITKHAITLLSRSFKSKLKQS